MNDLVATPQDDGKKFTGAGPLDGFEDIAGNVDNAFEEGKSVDPVQLGIDGAGAALDVAGAIVDPLGTLASSAVGWIIENVGFVREPFDKLMGDPPAIEAAANTFANISQHLSDVGEQHKSSLSQITSWQGQSGEAYRGEAKNLAGHIANAAAGADSASNKIKTAGILVASTRALIRDLLAELAGTLITWGLGALAAATPTAGASIGAFIARAVAKGAEIAGRVSQYLKQLFNALDQLGGMSRGASDALRGRADDLAASAANRTGDSSLDNFLKRKEEGMADQLRQRADKQDARDQRLDDFARRREEQAQHQWDRAEQKDREARDLWQQGRQDARQGADMSSIGYDRLSTSADQMSNGPLSGSRVGDAAAKIDDVAGKSLGDGQNMVRGVFSGDLGHVKPSYGDLVPGLKEGAKETNKAFGQEDEEKPFNETDREKRGSVHPVYDDPRSGA